LLFIVRAIARKRFTPVTPLISGNQLLDLEVHMKEVRRGLVFTTTLLFMQVQNKSKEKALKDLIVYL
jgi:hypothetical protein